METTKICLWICTRKQIKEKQKEWNKTSRTLSASTSQSYPIFCLAHSSFSSQVCYSLHSSQFSLNSLHMSLSPPRYFPKQLSLTPCTPYFFFAQLSISGAVHLSFFLYYCLFYKFYIKVTSQFGSVLTDISFPKI